MLNNINSFNAFFQNKTILIHKITETSDNILKDFCSNYVKLDILSNNELKNINVADLNNYLPNKNINLERECDKYI